MKKNLDWKILENAEVRVLKREVPTYRQLEEEERDELIESVIDAVEDRIHDELENFFKAHGDRELTEAFQERIHEVIYHALDSVEEELTMEEEESSSFDANESYKPLGKVYVGGRDTFCFRLERIPLGFENLDKKIKCGLAICDGSKDSARVQTGGCCSGCGKYNEYQRGDYICWECQ